MEGYQNSFDFILFEKIIYKQSTFILIEIPKGNSAKYKMKFMGHWLRYSTTPNVTTLYTESSQAIKLSCIFVAANLTWSLPIFLF